MKFTALFLIVLSQRVASDSVQSNETHAENSVSDENPEVKRSFGNCTFPGSPRHGRVAEFEAGFPENSTIEFECDPGYMLLGPKRTRCVSGKWQKGVPFCVMDVAREKPSFITPLGSPADGPSPVAGLALDGDDSTCATSDSTWGLRVWGVSLLEDFTVTTLKMVFGSRLEQAELEVRVGYDHPTDGKSTYEICWSGTRDFEANVAIYVKCEKPTPTGRFVSIHVRSEEQSPLSLCTVEVHSDSSLAPEDGCPQLMTTNPDFGETTVDFFHGKCIEFHTGDQKVPLSVARTICGDRGGRLVGRGLQSRGLEFLSWKTATLFGNDAFWVDATLRRGAWTWSNGQEMDVALVTEEGPGGLCLTSSSQGTFQPVDCDRDFRVICQFEPLVCGTPELPNALENWRAIGKLNVGQKLDQVQCHKGFYQEPDDRIVCHRNGTLTGTMNCHPFTCGSPPTVLGATIRVLSPDSVRYTCTTGRLVKGDSIASCDTSTLTWTNPPQCERLLDVVAQKVNSVQHAVKVHFQAGFQKYHSIPRGTRFGLVAALLTLVLVLVVGFVRCACLRTGRSVDKMPERMRPVQRFKV